MTFLFNDTNLKDKRRTLRKNQTDAESKLWANLRSKQFFGYKFYRQYSIDNYILDFYCHKLRLGIELDGGQHDEPTNKKYDQGRTEYIESQGITVVRFWNNDVLSNTEGVLEYLEELIK